MLSQELAKSRCRSPLAIYIVLSVVASCLALRMIELDVPGSSQVGDTLRLSCSYALERVSSEQIQRVDRKRQNMPARSYPPGERLYAVKWYKDEQEFFRFMEQDWPQKSVIPLEGLTVDETRSDNQSVVLKQVSLMSSGVYGCEVSTDAPSFVTKTLSRRLSVFSLPLKGPLIELKNSSSLQTLGNLHHHPARLEASCLSQESKPPAQLDWIINDSLNLSSLEPTSSWLATENRRFFQLTSQHESIAKALARFPPDAALLDQLYELQQNGSAISVSSSNKTMIVNAGEYLDQLAESSFSFLNLTIGQEFLQKIGSMMGSQSKIKENKSKKTAAYSRRLILELKCVARVLDISLKDSIKLTFKNLSDSMQLLEQSATIPASRNHHLEHSLSWNTIGSSATRIENRIQHAMHFHLILVIGLIVLYSS